MFSPKPIYGILKNAHRCSTSLSHKSQSAIKVSQGYRPLHFLHFLLVHYLLFSTVTGLDINENC